MLPYSILQFGDFYSALTAVWWTSLIVAQPGINYSLHSTLSLAGTVAIAVAVHYDPTSLASFLIPIHDLRSIYQMVVSLFISP